MVELVGGVVDDGVLLLPVVLLFGIVEEDDEAEPLSTIGSVEFALIESLDVVASVLVRDFLWCFGLSVWAIAKPETPRAATANRTGVRITITPSVRRLLRSPA